MTEKPKTKKKLLQKIRQFRTFVVESINSFSLYNYFKGFSPVLIKIDIASIGRGSKLFRKKYNMSKLIEKILTNYESREKENIENEVMNEAFGPWDEL